MVLRLAGRGCARSRLWVVSSAALGASGFVGSKAAIAANQFKGFLGQGVGDPRFRVENQGDVLDFRW